MISQNVHNKHLFSSKITLFNHFNNTKLSVEFWWKKERNVVFITFSMKILYFMVNISCCFSFFFFLVQHSTDYSTHEKQIWKMLLFIIINTHQHSPDYGDSLWYVVYGESEGVFIWFIVFHFSRLLPGFFIFSIFLTQFTWEQNSSTTLQQEMIMALIISEIMENHFHVSFD